MLMCLWTLCVCGGGTGDGGRGACAGDAVRDDVAQQARASAQAAPRGGGAAADRGWAQGRVVGQGAGCGGRERRVIHDLVWLNGALSCVRRVRGVEGRGMGGGAYIL